ncbi:MAG: arsenic resistance protein [Pseudomonadota bacterium]
MTLESPAARFDAPAESGPAGGTALLLLGAIMLGSVVGLTAPATGAALSGGTDLTLIVMISLLFFELRLRSVVHAFARLRFMALAWGANFLIVPVIGFVLTSLILPAEPVFFAGLMLYFLAPCTDWFLGFTRMARGDTETGAALIPVNMMTQLLLFPLWLWLFTTHTGFIDFAAIPGALAEWFLLPLLGVQALRLCMERLLPQQLFGRILEVVGQLVPLALGVLILQLFAGHVGLIGAHLPVFAMIAVAVFLFFATTLVVGEKLAQLGGLAYRQRALLAMTMAARNAPMMLVMTAVAIPDQPLIQAAIVFGMLIEIPHLTVLKQVLLRRAAH